MQQVSLVQKHSYPTEMTFFCMWGANRAAGIQSHWFSSWGWLGFVSVAVLKEWCWHGTCEMCSWALLPAPWEHLPRISSAARAMWLFIPPPSWAALLCACPSCRSHGWCSPSWLHCLWALCKVSIACPLLRWARDTLQWSRKEASILCNYKNTKKWMYVCIYLTNRIKPYFFPCLLLFLLPICVPPVPLGDPVPLTLCCLFIHIWVNEVVWSSCSRGKHCSGLCTAPCCSVSRHVGSAGTR